jgi:transposase
MRKIREVLRLKNESDISHRDIATSCSIARSTVADYLRRAKQAGLCWPLPDDLDDRALDERLFPPQPSIPSDQRPKPDWPKVHCELRRKSVTRFLLWQEYKAVHPVGIQYSQFCDLYSEWRECQDPVMRQVHKAGEKLFVDYAGQTVPVVDPRTGEIREAELFVAVLGASSYTYCEATWTQSLPDWISSHVRTFEFMGGVAEILVPDNLKAGVTSPHLYEPDLNPTYQDLARHYGVAVIPARVGRPKDKAKVEVGVQVAERQILAWLRNRTFFSLSELNRAISELLGELNTRPFQKLLGSRRSLYEDLDRPALGPLPVDAYQFAEWLKVRVHINYHVQVDKHNYSVPHRLIKKQLEVRLGFSTVEMFLNNERVASHQRSGIKDGYTTVGEHMPESHRQYAGWTPERIIRWAAETGGATSQVAKAVMENRPHPQQGFKSCLGIMRLGKTYGKARLEAACQRSLALETTSYKSIQSILKHNLDSQPLPEEVPEPKSALKHGNIRGAQYYDLSLFPVTESGGRGEPC